MELDSLSLTAHAIGPDEVGAVRAILLEAAADLTIRYGPGHWSRVHGLPTLRRHQAERIVLLVLAGSRPAATLTLGRKKPPFYHNSWFAEPKAAAVYLSDMAVLPALQRHGIGRWCIQQAELLAREWGAHAIRLDAYQASAGAGGFYQKCGFTLVHAGTLDLEYYEKTLT